MYLKLGTTSQLFSATIDLPHDRAALSVPQIAFVVTRLAELHDLQYAIDRRERFGKHGLAFGLIGRHLGESMRLIAPGNIDGDHFVVGRSYSEMVIQDFIWTPYPLDRQPVFGSENDLFIEFGRKLEKMITDYLANHYADIPPTEDCAHLVAFPPPSPLS